MRKLDSYSMSALFPVGRQLGYQIITRVRRTTETFYRRITRSLGPLPDFIIIGGQRCGTTSFFNYLSQHPYILSSFKKEVRYFSHHYANGEEWYRSQFPKKHNPGMVTGEATPYYMMYPHAPQRAYQLVPNAKLIALLRNPVDRAYSQYRLEVSRGRERLSFIEALKAEEDRIRCEYSKLVEKKIYRSHNYERYTYFARGIYIDQLRRWFRFYPKEQMFIIQSEDLYAQPAEVMRQVFDYLEVPPMKFDASYVVHNAAPKNGELDEATRAWLAELYKPYNEKLFAYLGRTFDWD